MDDTVHDDLKHGESKQQFGTGAQRDTQGGKTQYSLLPPGPVERLCVIYTKGGVHYGPHNWTMGIPYSRYLDSHDRHIRDFKMGKTDEDHLAMAVWNLFGIMHHQENGPPGLDDLPRWNDAQWQSTGLTPDQVEHPEIYPHIFEKLQETGKLTMVVNRVGSSELAGALVRMGLLEPIESEVDETPLHLRPGPFPMPGAFDSKAAAVRWFKQRGLIKGTPEYEERLAQEELS